MRIFPGKSQKIGYIYLLQLLIPAFYLYFMQSWLQIVLGILLLGMLATAYIFTWWTTGRRFALVLVSEIVLMIIMGAVLNPGFLSVVFWPAAAIGQLKNKVYKIGALSALILSGLVEIGVIAHIRHASLKPWWPMVFAGVAAAVVTVYAVQWQKDIYFSKHALELANAEIERLSKTAERERISQDLHDVLGHELALITLKSQLAEKLVHRDGDQAQQELRDIRDSAKRTLTRVRDYIAHARSPVLAEEWASAKQLLSTADIHLEMDRDIPDISLADPCSQALAMTLRELATNIVRHSSASSVKVCVERDADGLYLCVGDDGTGFTELETQTEGRGVSGIAARLSAVNGQLGIMSRGKWLTHWHPERVAVRNQFPLFTTLFVACVPVHNANEIEVEM